MRHYVLPATITALSLLAACAEPLDRDDPATAPSWNLPDPEEDPGCQGWKCTGNSPVMSGYGFIELHENQVANDVGFRLHHLRKEGIVYHPDVRGDRLYGLGAGGAIALAGPALEDAELVLSRDGTPGEFAIQIHKVNNLVTFWTAPYTTIETYELTYTGPDVAKRTPLCPNPPPPTTGDGHMWAAPGEAILFNGDRYDPNKRIIASTPTEAGDWFNIGCAGSALAKLHLNRFTAAGKRPAQPATSRAERQDVLAMYTGNVCGTGTAYTIPDTQIRWASRNGYHQMGAFATYEAVWGGGRAVCMSSWRLDATHPELREQMKLECGELPPCSQALLGSWQTRGTVLSAVP